MKPLSNQVLIKVAEKVEKIGSIIFAASSQEDDNTGVVVSVGPGAIARDGTTLIPMNVAVGDTVMFTEKKGVQVTHDGGRHLLVAETDILAVM